MVLGKSDQRAPEKRLARTAALAYLRIELIRRLKSPRGLAFTVLAPVGLFLLLGLPLRDQPLTSTPVTLGGISMAEYLLVSVEVYGVMVASASAGAAVAIERSIGWSRFLRITPLPSWGYLIAKAASALVLSIFVTVALLATGLSVGVQLSTLVWVESSCAAWLGSVLFAGLGITIGSVLPAQNVMQALGPLFALLALFGGLFVPLNIFPPLFQAIASWTPAYGVGALSHMALLKGPPTWTATLNVVCWLFVLSLGAPLALRRTSRGH
jgi:ABC-2 type transport system permease protein